MRHKWIHGNWRDVCDRCEIVRVRTPTYRCHYERISRRGGEATKEWWKHAPKCEQRKRVAV